MKSTIEFRVRVYRDDRIAIGPGKVALLEAISEAGSIAAAARLIGMSYRRAWLLVDETNRAMKWPVVGTATGGAKGGGTVLTPSGLALVARYRALEAAASRAAEAEIAALQSLLAP